MSFQRFVAKCLRGSALNLSQPSCLPHDTSSHHGKKDAYKVSFQPVIADGLYATSL
jgi:hypothetical protein